MKIKKSKLIEMIRESVNEAAPMGRASVVGLSKNKDLVIPKNQMSKAKGQYKKMMNHLMKAGKSMNQSGEIDMMVSHMEDAYDEMLALWKNVKEVKKESVNEAKIYSDDWNLTKRVTSNFIKQNLKSVDNSIKKKDGEGLRFHLNQIIKGIQNAKRALKLESVVTEANESKWTWIYKGMLSGFKKVGGGNDVNLEEVARATAFLVKTEYGAGAKNDFIKSLKKYIR